MQRLKTNYTTMECFCPQACLMSNACSRWALNIKKVLFCFFSVYLWKNVTLFVLSNTIFLTKEKKKYPFTFFPSFLESQCWRSPVSFNYLWSLCTCSSSNCMKCCRSLFRMAYLVVTTGKKASASAKMAVYGLQKGTYDRVTRQGQSVAHNT